MHDRCVLEEFLIFKEDEFDNLALVDGCHGNVLGLHLGPHQRRPKYNGHILCLHPVLFAMFYHSEK